MLPHHHFTVLRDRGVFEALRGRVLPAIAVRAKREGREACIWSAGSASGEEPYTLKIIWDLEVTQSCPGASLSLVATDIDVVMLARAREACFEATSLHELPPHLIEQAFDRAGPRFCVKPQHREGINFLDQDLRTEAPTRLFDLILCRYVAFTDFAPPLQEQVLTRIIDQLLPNGYLAIGTHERLPAKSTALMPLAGAPQIFEKRPVL